MLDIVLFTAGIILLLDGANIFVKAAINVADNLKISKVVLASIILAIGTSLPELSITISAVLKDNAPLAIGNIVGSNIANIFLVLPLAVLFAKRFIVSSEELKDSAHLLILASIIFLFLLDRGYSSILGIVSLLLAGLLIYSQTAKPIQERAIAAYDTEYTNRFLAIMGLLGLGALIIGSQLTADAATRIAVDLGVSDYFVGLILLALSTSLPELATTLAAIKQQEFKVAAGNLVNSNLFNILLVGGAGALSGQFVASQTLFTAVMFGLTGVVTYGIFRFYGRKPMPKQISLGLIGVYVIYLIHVVGLTT